MNTLATKYDPKAVEDKWYKYWIDNDLFKSVPDEREPYTIVIPPPNVTGVLHMGHMLNNTIQDILMRRARQEGKNALWVPGTDHASIATEAKVVKRLAEQGIKKTDLTRDEFLKHAWDWTHEHGGIILQQLRKLGASCDWSRTAFTMDEIRSESVLRVFVDLYEKGLIYRGLRMVNWDPKAQTALSNEEVIYREEKSKLYYLRYYVADDDLSGETGAEGEVVHRDEQGRRYAVVATTRPETIMGDTAMCINPKDPKNQWLRGKKVIVPLVNRVIQVIEDRYVDIEFGTGCLKVTPAHDVNDYMLGKNHNLETIDIFNADATISDQSPLYVGMHRDEVRKVIVKDLEAAGLMEKVEDYDNKVGYSERNSDTAVEPRLCMQWFIDMKHFADLALPPVMNDDIKFFPPKYKNTYRSWLENIQDWCISRQLWWGHRIPAYFLPTNGDEEKYVVALTKEEALEKARKIEGYENIGIDDLRQDEDALDTWFSSWLWPISLFDGIRNPGNEEIKYYYPTSDLVTAPDIIFFWVTRMIMAGYEYIGQMPFRNVYFTGIVRDKLGRKMSKSLGNSPDPLMLIDKFGADGVRMGMMLSAPAGNDILFDEALCEQGRNFNNKIWNAFRLVKGWEVATDIEQPEHSRLAIEWFNAQLNSTLAEVKDLFTKFRISDALMAIYRLFWEDFSALYLEIVKPAYQQPIDQATMDATLGFFDTLLRLIHPFMPFISEELWQHISERKPGESIMYAILPEPKPVDEAAIKAMTEAREIVTAVRNVRASKNIANKTMLELQVASTTWTNAYQSIIIKLAGLSTIAVVEDKDPTAASFMEGTTEFAVPLHDNINVAEEIEKLEKELEYAQGFLASVEKKLSNERFVANAPEAVVAAERKKQADAQSKIATLQETLAALRK